MRTLFFYIILFIYPTFVFPQTRNAKWFVDALYECSWNFVFLQDTTGTMQQKEDRLVLKIGKEITYGYSYLSYQGDSSITADALKWSNYFLENVKNGTTSNLTIGHPLATAKLFKDYKKKKISVIDNISTHSFIYEEALEPQTWTIFDETMTITGYLCQKAVCDYRGRSYEAWFTSEIPISEGPWKFYGLPGLIIKLYDTKRHYEFELVEFKKSDTSIDIQPLSTKKITVIGQTKKLTKIERAKFLAMKFGNHGDMLISAEMAKVGLHHEPVERKYGYIELDY